MQVMRMAVVVGAIVLSVSRASAAPTKRSDLEKLIRAHVVALGEGKGDDELRLSSSVQVTGGNYKVYGTNSPQSIREMLYPDLDGDVTHTPGKIVLGIDDKQGLAWFQAEYRVAFTPSPGSSEKAWKGSARVGGLLERQGKGAQDWVFAALAYSQDLDKEAKIITLAKAAKADLPDSKAPPMGSGNSEAVDVTKRRLVDGFGPPATKKAPVIASGLVPGELLTGAAAAALAKKWDSRKLVFELRLYSQTHGNGDFYFADADMLWPTKDANVRVAVNLLMVKDGIDEASKKPRWRWVSLQVAPR